MTSLAWPDSPAYADLTPAPESPAPAPPAAKFDPAVERWRPLAQKYFQPQDVDKALYVITHESSGDPSVMNSDAAVNGPSPGLFQITAANAKAAGIDGTDPEQAMKWAAGKVAEHGWSDWGEGTHYNGVNFGALGQANPYGPGGTGRNDIGAITGGAVGRIAAGNASLKLRPASTSEVSPSDYGLDEQTGPSLRSRVSSTPDIDQQAPGTLRQQGIDSGAFENWGTSKNPLPIAKRLQAQAGDIGADIGGVIPDFTIPKNLYGKGLSYQNEDGTSTKKSPSLKVSPKEIGRGVGEGAVPASAAEFAAYGLLAATPLGIGGDLQAGAGIVQGVKGLAAGGAKSLLRGAGGSIIEDVGGQAAKDAAAGAMPGLRGQVAELGDTGIKDALAAKAEATLPQGRIFGDQGSLQRKVVGALNPSVDIPQEVHVANQSRTAVQATLRTELSQAEIPAYRKLESLFNAEKPQYIGPAGRPLAGTWIDYGENPSLYTASPELRGAKDELKAVQEGVINHVRSGYNVDVKPFQGADPEGVYIPHMQSREDMEQAVARTEQSLSSRSSVAKERAYDSLSDRMARQPDFKPETDATTLADVHSGSLASMAANNTFKAGAGGKTLTDVVEELHPNLIKQRDYVANRVQAVKAKIDLAEQRLGEHGAAADVLAREKAAIEARAVPKFVEVSEADKLTPEMKKLQVQLGELKIRANSIDRAANRVSGKGFAADLRMRDAQDELSSLEPQLAELRQRYHTAGIGDYTLNKSTYKYHDPRTSAAIDTTLKTGVNNAFIERGIEAGNTMRAVALGPDFSPLSIQGFLGALSHPEIAVKNAVGFAKAAMTDAAGLRALADPESIRRFEFASGRRLGSFSEEADQGAKGIGLPGRPVKKFNDALERMVDLGTVKAFEADSKILQGSGLSQNVADHEAANSISKFVPRLNNAETGRSVQRVKMEGVVPTSRSFTAQPFSLAKDFGSGVAKLATGGELLGRERLALLRGATMLGTMSTIAVTSALLSAEANGKNPAESIREVLDPDSSRFMTVQLGSAGSIPIGGPFRRAFLGVYKTGVAPIRHEITGEDYRGKQGLPAAIGYGRNTLQPEIGATSDIVTNRDWKGDPIRSGSSLDQLLQTAAYLAKSGNLLAGGTVQGAQDNGATGAATAALSGIAGVNFQERNGVTDARNRESMKRYGQHYDDLLTSQQGEIDALPAVAGKKSPPTVYAQDRDRRVQERTDAIAQKVDAWTQGKLSDKTLPENLTDIKAAFYQSLDDLRKDKNNTEMFAKLPDRKHQETLDGFFATQTKHTDGSIDWDTTIVDRDRYMAKLDPKERTWLDDYIGVQDAKKLPIEKEIATYNDKRESLGYFKDGLSQSDKAKLDRDNPDVDVQTWKYYGGLEDKTKHPDPSLNSTAAVDLALADPMSKSRQVKLQGIPRAINESDKTRAAYDAVKKPLQDYMDGVKINEPGTKDRVAASHYKDKDNNPLKWDQLTNDQQSSLRSYVNEIVRERDPVLDATMAWLGKYSTVMTFKAGDELRKIRAKYGDEPPPKPGDRKIHFADTAY